MNWIETRIYTTSEGVEPVCGCLMCIGINGFQIKDPRDFQDFLDRKDGNWDYYDDDLEELRTCETCVTVYIEDNTQGADILSALRSEMAALKERDVDNAFGRLAVELSDISEEDWADNWKKYFKPITIGDKLIVKPSWETCETGGRAVVEIDPASSFGTGQHETTRLCLELIEKYIQKDVHMLDMGCGSGILSIAGMLLGAADCAAVDIDSGSTATAAENARKNHISEDKYKTFCGNIIGDRELAEKVAARGKAGIITANIVADVLIAMAPLFKEFADEHCVLIISGIIIERCDEVLAAMRAQCYVQEEIKENNGWAAAVFRIGSAERGE